MTKLKAALAIPFLLGVGNAVAADYNLSITATPSASGMVIYPIWGQQNIWRPWSSYYWQSGTTDPIFGSYMKEAALVMPFGDYVDPATGIHEDIPSLYNTSAPFNIGTTHFDRIIDDNTHPFFANIRRLVNAGLRPSIDIGPVPSDVTINPTYSPAFHWEISTPLAQFWPVYRDYIRQIFQYLVFHEGYTVSQLLSWRYQLGREPDNPDSFEYGAANIGSYELLYDHTLYAMRSAAAGMENVVLDFGNVVLPNTGCGAVSIVSDLYNWLGHGAASLPGLTLPRIPHSTDTVSVNFSLYSTQASCGQMGRDPTVIPGITASLKSRVQNELPNNPLRLVVSEGNYLGDDVGGHPEIWNRSDGSELGAAWNAAVFVNGYDGGLARYTQWGFVSAQQISMWYGNKSTPAGPRSSVDNVIDLFQKMEGGRRSGFVGGDIHVQGIAARRGSNDHYILMYNYDKTRVATDKVNISLAVLDLIPNRNYTLFEYRVDKDHGVYMTKWINDLHAAGLGDPPRKYDPIIVDPPYGGSVTPAQWNIWNLNKDSYMGIAASPPMVRGPQTQNVPASGVFADPSTITLPPNSVSLVRVVNTSVLVMPAIHQLLY